MHGKDKSHWSGTPLSTCAHTLTRGWAGTWTQRHSTHILKDRPLNHRAAEIKARLLKLHSKILRHLHPEAAGRPVPEQRGQSGHQADRAGRPPWTLGAVQGDLAAVVPRVAPLRKIPSPTPARNSPGRHFLEPGAFIIVKLRLSLAAGEGGAGLGAGVGGGVRGLGASMEVRVRPWGPCGGSSGSVLGAQAGAGGWASGP